MAPMTAYQTRLIARDEINHHERCCPTRVEMVALRKEIAGARDDLNTRHQDQMRELTDAKVKLAEGAAVFTSHAEKITTNTKAIKSINGRVWGALVSCTLLLLAIVGYLLRHILF